jgi:hypothetical protein
MQQQLAALWDKAVENKTTLIKVGSAVLGALLGLVVTTIVTQETMSAEDDLVAAVLSDDE